MSSVGTDAFLRPGERSERKTAWGVSGLGSGGTTEVLQYTLEPRNRHAERGVHLSRRRSLPFKFANGLDLPPFQLFNDNARNLS